MAFIELTTGTDTKIILNENHIVAVTPLIDEHTGANAFVETTGQYTANCYVKNSYKEIRDALIV